MTATMDRTTTKPKRLLMVVATPTTSTTGPVVEAPGV
jgi:hypothetical protein